MKLHLSVRQYKKIAIVAALLLSAHETMASHHFETAAVRKVTALNQLDNYVFESSRKNYTVFVMSVNSAPKLGTDGVFATNALYNIHVSSDEKFSSGHTFSMAFSADQFTLYDTDKPNGAVGVVGPKIGSGGIGKQVEIAGGIKVWAGTAKDPFYGNSPGLGLFRTKLNSGVYDSNAWTAAKGTNIFTGRLSSVIVLEVPNSMLGSDVKVFMTTAVKDGDKWEQVQYSANPLFSHSMLFESETLKTQHDHSRPDSDAEMKNYVSARVARASGLAKTQPDPFSYGDKVAAMLVPDVLSYKVGSKAEYSNQMRNGRAIDDDAMSVMLSLWCGTPVDQAIPNPKLYTAAFPYIIPAELK
ncbi:hypothetical protein ACO0LO_18495 [Undibacterium sp. TJN25]|uniref:hypothetical protein n=1 Tax=Undibacterium sp. TJN25 TaxID=3413056 RepID=UPI003BF0337E